MAAVVIAAGFYYLQMPAVALKNTIDLTFPADVCAPAANVAP